MKKSKLSIGLVTSFIAAMSITGCGKSVTSNDKALVTFKPYGSGSEVTIVTDKMYNDYRATSAGITKFYEQILEVLIRYDFQNNGKASEKNSLGKIEKLAEKEVSDQKTKAKENAKSNNTKYEDEWEAILESNGVEDAKELKELFIYNHEKETMQDWYYEENEEVLKKEYIGITEKDGHAAAVEASEGYGKLTSKLPYHIRHILVKNEDGASNFVNGTIDESASKKLYDVVKKISDGEFTFGRISLENSEDTGSAAKFGDVGIVTNNASEEGSLTMVSEFQLGIYAYDAILSGKTEAAINNGLGLGADSKFTNKEGVQANVADFIKSNKFAAGTSNTIEGLTEVPFNVFQDLYDYRDVTSDKNGQKVLDTDQETVVYPRNILWNKYLNHHNPFIITNRNRTTIANQTVVTNGNTDTLESGYDASIAEKQPGTCGFKSAKDLGITNDANMKVLTDEKDNVIIGVRSQYGIHLTVVEKSIFDFNNDKVSLEEYYTTLTPSDDKYPTNTDGSAKNTYVNYIKTDEKSTLDSRAEEVKNAIKTFDSTYDYRLYEYLLNAHKDVISFKEYDGISVDTLIDTYIKLQREKTFDKQTIGMNKAWQKYLEMIELQNESRQNEKRIVPEGCVIGFKKDTAGIGAAEYQKGGKCYYGK